MTLGERVKFFRIERGFSQAALGKIVGFHGNYMGRIENNLVNPSFKAVLVLCEAMDVSPNELAGWEIDRREDDIRERVRCEIIKAVGKVLSVDPREMIDGPEFEFDPDLRPVDKRKAKETALT